jgi:hypothetical protein
MTSMEWFVAGWASAIALVLLYFGLLPRLVRRKR